MLASGTAYIIAHESEKNGFIDNGSFESGKLHYQNHLNFKPFISVAERKIN
jgi:hypothetical protein